MPVVLPDSKVGKDFRQVVSVAEGDMGHVDEVSESLCRPACTLRGSPRLKERGNESLNTGSSGTEPSPRLLVKVERRLLHGNGVDFTVSRLRHWVDPPQRVPVP